MKDNKFTTLFIGIFFGIGISILTFLTITNLSGTKTSSDVKYKKATPDEVTNEYSFNQTENIVFLGDSITEIYPIEEIFGDKPIVKSGVSGYYTTDILERMDEMVYRYNPTKVFLLIGTNDLCPEFEDTREKTIEGIEKIVKNIKENRPNTKIYVESIYPVNKTMEGPGGRNDEEIQYVNKKVKEFCIENDVTYIDMYKDLIDEDNDFYKPYTYDGLHPSHLGYARISQLLLPYIEE